MAARPQLRRAVLGLAGLLVLAGCSATSKGSGTSFVAGDGTVTTVAASSRGEPVTLSGTTLAGNQLDVATLRGEPVVLNVWGSWCAPCRKEAPGLVAAAHRLAGSAHVVGINVRDSDAQAKAYERTFSVTYPSLVDPDGQLLLALRGAVSPSSIPSTVVLDDRGRIAARVSGPVDTSTLVGLVQDVSSGVVPKAAGR